MARRSNPISGSTVGPIGEVDFRPIPGPGAHRRHRPARNDEEEPGDRPTHGGRSRRADAGARSSPPPPPRSSTTSSASSRARRPRSASPWPCCWPKGTCSSRTSPASARPSWPRRWPRSIDCTVRRIQFTPDLLPSRRHRGERLQPGDPRLRVQAGRDLRQHRGRRRDQPGLAEDPVGAAGVHGGAAGHRRRRDLSCCRRRSWWSRPRTRSRWRAPTRCPRHSATGSPRASRWATPTRPPNWRCWTCTAREDPLIDLAAGAPRDDRTPTHRHRSATSTSPTPSSSTRSTSPTPPASPPTCGWAPHPGPPSSCCAPRGRSPRWRAATTSLPDDLQSLAVPVLAHRIIPTAEAQLARRTTDSIVAEIIHRLPLPGDRQPRSAADPRAGRQAGPIRDAQPP